MDQESRQFKFSKEKHYIEFSATGDGGFNTGFVKIRINDLNILILLLLSWLWRIMEYIECKIPTSL